MRHLAILAAIGGCTGKGTTDATGTTGTTGTEPQTWYLGCGDPVCNGYTGPFDGVPLCADVGATVGDPCTAEGDQCDPVDSCNALAVCASENPTTQTGGCPISLRKYKHAVHYLSPAERAAAAQQLLDVPLATWHYNWEGEGDRSHLGFLIDDQPSSPAVQADGAHVDLYGYTSLAVAAIQAQQAQIDALKAEVEALKQTCR